GAQGGRFGVAMASGWCGLVFVVLMCGGVPTVHAESETPRSLLISVNTAHGIKRAEADAIARAYFLQHVGCVHMQVFRKHQTSGSGRASIVFAAIESNGFIPQRIGSGRVDYRSQLCESY